jgi:cyclase
MLKHRIIPTLLWTPSGLVKGIAFDSWRVVSALQPAIRLYCLREVDELILLNIDSTCGSKDAETDFLLSIASICRVPLTVGGGVRSLQQCRKLLLGGADKVLINSYCYEDPEIISQVAKQFGSQVLVVGVDVRHVGAGKYSCFSHRGNVSTGKDMVAWCREVQNRGAGEIMLQSVERDGGLCGYDLELMRTALPYIDVPTIVSGGCSGYPDMLNAIKLGADAVAASALFQFTKATPREAKLYLHANGVPVRR